MVFLPSTPDFKLDCQCSFHEESQELYKLEVNPWPVHRDLGTTSPKQSFKNEFCFSGRRSSRRKGGTHSIMWLWVSHRTVVKLIKALDRK